MPATLECRHEIQTYDLEAGVPLEINLAINGARDWTAVIRNTGSNDVDAGEVSRSPLGRLFDDAVAIPSGSLAAAGQSMRIEGVAEPIQTLRLTLTSTLGTTLSIEAGGL